MPSNSWWPHTLDFDGGATLLAMIQQENLWTDIQKQALGTCIQEKVQEGMKGQGFTNRTQMQDYQYFPLYLTTQEWSFIQQQRVHETQTVQSYGGEDCEVEMQGSIRGCTQAMVTTLCLLGDHSRFNDGLMLRAAYINMKGIIKGSLKTAVASLNEKSNKRQHCRSSELYLLYQLLWTGASWSRLMGLKSAQLLLYQKE